LKTKYRRHQYIALARHPFQAQSRARMIY